MKKVLLIGEAMALFAAEESGPLKAARRYRRLLSGAEVNVAIGLRRLGAACAYVTRLGADPLGQAIGDRLAEEGIDTSFVSFDEEYPTGIQLKGKTEKGDPEISYYRKGSAASHMSPAQIDAIDFDEIGRIHVTGIPAALSSGCRQAIFALVERARELSIPTTFDPNLRPALWPSRQEMIRVINLLATRCDVVLPGLAEGQLLSECASAEGIANFYLSSGCKAVVIKEGPSGAYAASERGGSRIRGYRAPQVVDTVGAGDGFAVGLISALLEGLELEDAVARGNAIGAMQVSCLGDNEGLPDRRALDAFMRCAARV
ncbi:2-keto-3-deoxygluconate kinase [Coriobacterium glomerans PW2]|uniref:2-keto-3-deoxygluconate kinase n=1 Tax=Coriobacterium glomerans (strain ATCC 49209 / DSM 20642 / JCM 10262 / PW2) TaxID=700015 RepID=F2N7S0_CORGP|nr:sugar kinase [Coriobacterium glomerans]AEB06962.1 2-keto-3-deoxygluconate kinase [Coriobacterium glomerans PW2]